MRIDSNKPLGNEILTDHSVRKSGKPENSGTAASDNDAKGVSADTFTVSALTARAMATPDVREDKVAALREALKNGSYDLDPGKIADAILGESE